MASYLVTGAAGFIARSVVRELLRRGHVVVGVDNLNSAYDVRLKERRLADLRSLPAFRFHHLDICDRRCLESLPASSFEGVINLAAWAGVRQSVENPWVYMETNAIGTLNLLEFCRGHGIRKFVLASTSSLYGPHNPIPYREDADTSRPLSPYAASKKAAEALCHTYHVLHGLDVTVLRYFTVFGPAGRPDMSPFRFVQWITEGRPVVVYGDGSQSRDFTYVDDIARGTVAGLRPMGYAAINLGSDHPIRLKDAISLIERLVGRQARMQFRPAHPADVSATWADIRRARDTLGWAPSISFEHGMERVVNWYLENRAWAREIETSDLDRA